ncbi:hypothetical protein D3C80_1294600 [compost metagenome]
MPDPHENKAPDPLITPAKLVIPPEFKASRFRLLAVPVTVPEKVFVPEVFKPPRKRVEASPLFIMMLRVKFVPPLVADK